MEKGRPSDIESRWPPGTRQIFTWLYPDGRVEPAVLTTEPWPDKKVPNFGSGSLIPLREGFLIRFGRAKGPKDSGTLGAYLLRNNHLTKAIVGYVASLATSPDGCKVAFVHYPYSDATIAADPAPITLKAINLCVMHGKLRAVA